MNRFFFLTIITFFSLPNLFSQSPTWYVNKTASGANSGLSWTDAFTNLQSACNAAASGDMIWVASGEYKPDAGTNRDKYFALKSGVKIYGGFSGGENSLGQRNLLANPVILSGNIGNQLDSTDNSYTLLYLAYPDTSTLIDGLTFQHGYAVSDTSFFNNAPTLSGGAVYIESKNGKALPVFKNCNFLNNVAKSKGGAIYINGQGSTDCMPLFYHCNFINNKSLFQGGAIYMTGGIAVDRGNEFRDCRFERNSASYQAGGIYYSNSYGSGTLNFQHCVITQNTAYHFGGFMYMPKFGANPVKITIDSTELSKNYSEMRQSVLYVESNSTQPYQTIVHLTKSIISDNKQGVMDPSNFGIITIDGPSTESSALDTLIIDSNEIFNNISNIGYLVQVYPNFFSRVRNNLIFNNAGSFPAYLDTGSEVAISGSGKNVEISGNIAFNNSVCPLGGGAIATPFSKLLIYNNLLFNNNVLGGARGNYILSLGVFSIPSYPRQPAQVFNNVFVNNKITVASNPFHFYWTPLSSLRNNIFINNTDAATGARIIPFRLNWDSLYLASNLLDLDCATLPSPVICGAGNIYTPDAFFVDTAAGNFHLQPCSPAINAGDNSMIQAYGIGDDFDGQPRIIESTVDIGAYESPAFALAAPPELHPACAGTSGGAITLHPANGCEPYTYQWMPPAGNGPTVSDLPPGDYSFRITDGQGRSIADTLYIPAVPSPQISLQGDHIHCNSGAGGSALATAVGGTPPYSYLWSTGSTASQLSMLPVGSYVATVTDANGCQSFGGLTLNLDGQLTLQVDGQPISCFGESDAMLSATPVTGAAPYTYLWSPGGNTDAQLTGLGPGMYTVTATDTYGCSATFTFTLVEPQLLQASASAMPTNSLQNPNGSATANTSGGTPTLAYAWSNGGNSQTIAGLAPGLYTVTVTDAHGCSATAETEVQLVSSAGEATDDRVLVWPNPMTDKLILQATNLPAGACRFVLRDALGRELVSAGVTGGKALLEVHGLPPGSYRWSLEGKDGVLAHGNVLKM